MLRQKWIDREQAESFGNQAFGSFVSGVMQLVTKLFQVSMCVLILTILGCSASSPSYKARRAPLSVYEQQLQQADLYFTKQIEAGASDRLTSAYFEREKTRSSPSLIS